MEKTSDLNKDRISDETIFNLDKVKNLLKGVNLRLTHQRVLVLSAIANSEGAVSYTTLERSLSADIDRVTLYRTLKSFASANLVHTIADAESGTLYAICADGCNTTSHHIHLHNHVHFKCADCQKTVCIESIKIPDVALPDGFIFHQASLIISGTCKACNLSAN